MKRIAVEIAGATERQQAAFEDIRSGFTAALLAAFKRLDGIVLTVLEDGSTRHRAYVAEPGVVEQAVEELAPQLLGALVGALYVGCELGEATPLERELLEAAQEYRGAIPFGNHPDTTLPEATALLAKAIEYGDLVCGAARAPCCNVVSIGARRRK